MSVFVLSGRARSLSGLMLWLSLKLHAHGYLCFIPVLVCGRCKNRLMLLIVKVVVVQELRASEYLRIHARRSCLKVAVLKLFRSCACWLFGNYLGFYF